MRRRARNEDAGNDHSTDPGDSEAVTERCCRVVLEDALGAHPQNGTEDGTPRHGLDGPTGETNTEVVELAAPRRSGRAAE
jgi:hypothetical protein